MCRVGPFFFTGRSGAWSLVIWLLGDSAQVRGGVIGWRRGAGRLELRGRRTYCGQRFAGRPRGPTRSGPEWRLPLPVLPSSLKNISSRRVRYLVIRYGALHRSPLCRRKRCYLAIPSSTPHRPMLHRLECYLLLPYSAAYPPCHVACHSATSQYYLPLPVVPPNLLQMPDTGE
jgi:hypothetical protein